MDRASRILVVGSLVMDQIALTAQFPRSGQTVLGREFCKAPGGKGANQAVQAARLGADVTMLGKVGADANGEALRMACKEAGVKTEHILVDKECSSGCAVIILTERPDGGTENRIIVIPGTNMALRPEELNWLRDEIQDYDLVMLQLEIPMEINELVASLAQENNVPVMLNPAPSAPLSDRLLSCLDFISPNEHETEDLTGVHIAHKGRDVDMEAAARAAQILLDRGVKHVLITLGDAGAAFFSREGKHIFSPCVPGVQAVDPTAAGDSFVAAFCVGYTRGWEMEKVLAFANHTAAITVSGKGAMPSLPGLSRVLDSWGDSQAAMSD